MHLVLSVRKFALLTALALLMAGCSTSGNGSNAADLFPPASPTAQGNLQPDSDPSVLPGPILVADRDNNRLVVIDPQGRVLWQFPQPGDLQPGQQFVLPDDAFFTPDGKQIIATHEADFVVTLIDIASHRMVWQYGEPGVHGSGPNQLWNPDDAIVLPNGEVLLADIVNCRVLLIQREPISPSRASAVRGSATTIHRRPSAAPTGPSP